MDENKLNGTEQAETVEEPVTEAEQTETAEVTESTEPAEAAEKITESAPEKTNRKPGRIKNQRLLKKGSYSIAITAIVIAAIIVFNILVTALSERFVLDYDMSVEKVNSISDENIEYLKNIKKDVDIIFCAKESEYSNYMGYYAYQNYGVDDSAAADYYDQSIRLVKKYHSYNSKIKVRFVDTQSSQFDTITEEYPDKTITYGDIIVSAMDESGKKRSRFVKYDDIYDIQSDDTYAMYGMSAYTVSGNNIETAVTSAIAYVTDEKDKKAVFLTGHSTTDISAAYQKLLTANNYEVSSVADAVISSIPEDCDLVVIPGASRDFVASEIEVLSQFLDNDSRLGKGLIVYADASAPYLNNFYSFLKQWGISVGEGILFETNDKLHLTDDPMSLYSGLSSEDATLKHDVTSLCISDNNVPLSAAFEKQDYMSVGTLVSTSETTVAAPKGTPETWTGYKESDMKSYPTVMQAVKSNYDADDNEIESYLTVFSSTDFIDSEYNESGMISNKDLTFAIAEKSIGVGDSEISFISKEITADSFSESVTESAAKTVLVIFPILLPLLTLLAGVVIYIRRRNA